ncbi:MAG: hypothetical protein Q7K54_01650 [Candidatus Parcubacteria bacterium]|nr:hypothetical protein [Candidatus Parcubacteria bacterium]
MKAVLLRRRQKSRKRKAKKREDHSLKRAGERFGLNLGSHDYKKLVKQIKHGEADFVKNMSATISIWHVVLPGGKEAVALFDKELRVISTLMPVEWLEKNRI